MNHKLSLGLTALFVTVLLVGVYFDSLVFLSATWMGSEDYSHGMVVPLISVFLIWQARHRVARVSTARSWAGLGVLAAGLFLYWVGEFATLYVLQHVSLWVVIIGLVISFIGVPGAKTIAFPLAYLLVSIPLPSFWYATLSSQLQLWSSALGVSCLQLVGVTAFREGNVIDLGPVQLQVVEACSGIRYLLPLTALALLCAYLYKDKTWKRVVLVLSAIPISILVNGFRIGMIGVLIEWYGEGAAEGFYHLFEGWVLFMASVGLLILEMWALATIHTSGDRSSFLDRFTWMERSLSPSTLSCSSIRPHQISQRVFPGPAYLWSVALLIPVAVASMFMAERKEIVPPRAVFVDFPMELKGWLGTSQRLEKQYIDALRFDDYMLTDYRLGEGQAVNLFTAYYRSQRKGQSAHSPQSCLPGSGWEITSLSRVDLPLSSTPPHSVRINRALIQKDNQRQIILYWFKQRERVITDEYLVKWYLFWDAVVRARTDGALVRIASVVGSDETEAVVDRRLVDFATVVEPELLRYVPD